MKFLGALCLLLSLNTFALDESKSICGTDDRVPSTDPKVARALGSITDSGGCTVTMISSSCAISAGHCKSVLGIAEFNTPPSRSGRIQHPAQEDIYEIDQNSLKVTYEGIGEDWAVMKILPNKITGLLPGDAQGHYEVTFEAPEVNDEIIITGYGLDRPDPERNLAQQTHSGDITRFGTYTPTVMYHDADTMGGNSGSSILQSKSGKIIAIHTNGGCSRSGGDNAGTLIHNSPELVSAIQACLATE